MRELTVEAGKGEVDDRIRIFHANCKIFSVYLGNPLHNGWANVAAYLERLSGEVTAEDGLRKIC